MLTADQLDALPSQIIALYEEYNQSVIADMARRLAGLDFATPTAAWQMQRLTESGRVYETALAELAKVTHKSEASLRDMFEQAGVGALKFDDAIYRAAGLAPLPLNLSPAMAQALAAGLHKTSGVIHNLTMTTAINGQHEFIRAADLAYMQVSNGAMSYTQAIRAGVKQLAGQGLSVIDFASGHKDQLDVAMRRSVLTGVSQTAGMLQTRRADEMGCDLVQTSAHAGARPEHQAWQGHVFSRSGQNSHYPDFTSSTGYGTGTGLCGWNCRHSFYPFFEGISENAYNQAERDALASKTAAYNGQEISMYDATQQQRGMERKIRYWKRQEGALKAAGLDASAESAKVKAWQAQLRDFTKQTGLVRQRERESVVNTAKLSYQRVDLYSEKPSVIGRTPDLKNHFPEGTPGREFITSNDVELTPKRKEHVVNSHKDQITWLESNSIVIQKAISFPAYIDAIPFRDKGRWAVTHIVEVNHPDYDLLVVGVKHGKTITEKHEVLTIFLADKRFVFDEAGNLKSRWLKVK